MISSLNSTCFCIPNPGPHAGRKRIYILYLPKKSWFGIQKQAEFKEEITSQCTVVSFRRNPVHMLVCISRQEVLIVLTKFHIKVVFVEAGLASCLCVKHRVPCSYVYRSRIYFPFGFLWHYAIHLLLVRSRESSAVSSGLWQSCNIYTFAASCDKFVRHVCIHLYIGAHMSRYIYYMCHHIDFMFTLFHLAANCSYAHLYFF